MFRCVYVLHMPTCRQINVAHRVHRDFMSFAVQLGDAWTDFKGPFSFCTVGFKIPLTISIEIATYKKKTFKR